MKYQENTKEIEIYKEEEENNDFMLENEIENAIFSKPIVSKMNPNTIKDSKINIGPIQKELKEEEINEIEKPIENDKKESSPELKKNHSNDSENDSPQTDSNEDKKEKKFEKKTARKISHDDTGLNYNEDPLDYLFPKEKIHMMESPKKHLKEYEDVNLESLHRNSENVKHFTSLSDKKDERNSPHQNKNALSTSLVLDNKKYKIVLKKSLTFSSFLKRGITLKNKNIIFLDKKGENPDKNKEDQKEDKEDREYEPKLIN